MGRAAAVAVVCLALAVVPARATDPCDLDFGTAAREGGRTDLVPCGSGVASAASASTATAKGVGGGPATWDLPTAGKWRVSKQDSGGRVAEGCGVGVIEAPLTAVRAVIDAAADFDEFMPRILESEVEHISPGIYLNRQVLDMPFPAEDRRYTVRVESGTFGTGAGAGWQARWTYVEGSGNVRESRGSWTLVPLGPERTVVIYRLLTDPGGRLPAWMVDFAAPRALRRVLTAVRERVRGRM